MSPVEPKASPFEFREHDASAISDAFVCEVPAGVQSKAELLAAIAANARFPDYFGGNWDALLDCLRDLSWIEQRTIVILHRDLPMQAAPQDCRTYLEVLRDAVLDWRAQTLPRNATPAWPQHELLVLFPASLRTEVLSALG